MTSSHGESEKANTRQAERQLREHDLASRRIHPICNDRYRNGAEYLRQLCEALVAEGRMRHNLGRASVGIERENAPNIRVVAPRSAVRGCYVTIPLAA